MITLSLTAEDAWLLACAVAANFVLGVYHFLIVLESLKTIRVSAANGSLLAFAYASPPTLLVLAIARIGHII